MNIDELLVRAADDVASRVSSAAPDAAAIRASARSLRRRRAAGAGVAVTVACMLAVIALVPPWTDQENRPPTGPAPTAELDGAVWTDRAGLHVGTRLVSSPDAPPWHGNPDISGFTLLRDRVVYTRWYQGEGPCKPQIVYAWDEAGGSRRLGRDVVTTPIGDQLGDNVAWIDANRDLVVVDAPTGAEIARAGNAAALDNFCGNPIRSVTESTVTFVSAGVAYTFDWTASSEPSRVDLHGGELLAREGGVDAIGERTRESDEAGSPLFTLRFSTGSEVVEAIEPVTSWGVFSADGQFYATSTSSVNGRLLVFDAGTAAPVELDLAAEYFVATWGWGFGDTLMVGLRNQREEQTGPGPSPWRLAVCHVSEETCGFVTDDAGRPLDPYYPGFAQ